MTGITDLQHNRTPKVMSLNIWNFNLPQSCIWMQLFQPIMNGSNKSGRDHVVRASANPTLLLLCRSLLAQRSPTFSLCEDDCFHALWSEPLHQSLNVLHVSTKCLYFVKQTLMPFMLLRLFYVFIAGILSVLGTKLAFYVKNSFQH